MSHSAIYIYMNIYCCQSPYPRALCLYRMLQAGAPSITANCQCVSRPEMKRSHIDTGAAVSHLVGRQGASVIDFAQSKRLKNTTLKCPSTAQTNGPSPDKNDESGSITFDRNYIPALFCPPPSPPPFAGKLAFFWEASRGFDPSLLRWT